MEKYEGEIVHFIRRTDDGTYLKDDKTQTWTRNREQDFSCEELQYLIAKNEFRTAYLEMPLAIEANYKISDGAALMVLEEGNWYGNPFIAYLKEDYVDSNGGLHTSESDNDEPIPYVITALSSKEYVAVDLWGMNEPFRIKPDRIEFNRF